MVSLSRFRPAFRRATTTEHEAPPVVAMTGLPTSNEKNPSIAANQDAISPDNGPGEQEGAVPVNKEDLVPTEDAQRGVQQVEAVTLTWTKPYLVMVFFL